MAGGQVEIRVVAPTLRDAAVLERVVVSAADVIFAGYPGGGPSLGGDVAKGEVMLMLGTDTDDASEWLAQLRVLAEAVPGPSEVHVLRQAVQSA